MSNGGKNARTVDEFAAGLGPEQQKMVNTLRGIIRQAAPKITESIKWGMPCFEQDGLVCSIITAKRNVSLNFYRGAELADPQRALAGSGKKLRHVKLHAPSEIHKTQLTRLVKQAVQLNAEA